MNTLVALIGIVITAITALVVAYLHRKQMRQLEAYRADRSVGLIAPDTRITRWVKRRWHYLFLSPALISSVYEATKPGLPSRFSVLTIAINMTIFAVGLSVMISTEIVGNALTRIFGRKDGT
jgi:hypothetical protein